MGNCFCPSAAAALSGNIIGRGVESNKADCSWVISSVSKGSSVSISFSTFTTDSTNRVVIYSCLSSNSATSCESSVELASLGGYFEENVQLLSRSWTSTTGYMHVRFKQKYSDDSDVFKGIWTTSCSECPSGKPLPTVVPNHSSALPTVSQHAWQHFVLLCRISCAQAEIRAPSSGGANETVRVTWRGRHVLVVSGRHFLFWHTLRRGQVRADRGYICISSDLLVVPRRQDPQSQTTPSPKVTQSHPSPTTSPRDTPHTCDSSVLACCCLVFNDLTRHARQHQPQANGYVYAIFDLS